MHVWYYDGMTLTENSGEIVRVECGIVPNNKDVTKLTAADEAHAAEQFPYFYKMSGTDFHTELQSAPTSCPFKTQQFGEAAISVCIECPHRVIELAGGKIIY